MQVKVDQKPKATLLLTIVVPKDKVKQAYDDLFKQLVATAEIKGFRKGQAPAEIVRQNTDESKLLGETVNVLLQTYYPQALKEQHIMPIANPKVEITEFALDKDFEFTATVATKPAVKVGDYKTELKKIQTEKSTQLRELNAQKLAKGEKLQTDHVHLTPDDVIAAIINVTEVELAEIVLDDETDRLMSRLVDQAQAIGLSLEQYLKSQNKTAEDLRTDYTKIAERNLIAEFALAELIAQENVTVSEQEIDDMIKASADPKTQENLNDPAQKWYIRSILEKNKLVTQILAEVETPHEHDTNGNIKNTKNGDASSEKDMDDKKGENSKN